MYRCPGTVLVPNCGLSRLRSLVALAQQGPGQPALALLPFKAGRVSSPPSHTDILQHTSSGQQQGTLRTQEAIGPSRRDPLLLPPASHSHSGNARPTTSSPW